MKDWKKQTRVSDAVFTLDTQLNVLDANRSFLLFFRLTDCNCSFRDFLDDAGAKNLSYFLENFSESNRDSNFLINAKVSNEQILCILHVEKILKGFRINLAELTYYKERLRESVIKTEIFKSVLNRFNSFFFTFDGNNISFSNSKDLIPIFDNSIEEFKNFLPDFFKIDLSAKSSVKMFDRLFSHLKENKGEFDYRILQKGGRHISINTKPIQTSYGDFVVGVINTDGIKLPQESGYYQRDGLTDLYNKKTVTEMARKKIADGKSKGRIVIQQLRHQRTLSGSGWS